MIPFNKPYLTGKETHYIYQAVNSGEIAYPQQASCLVISL